MNLSNFKVAFYTLGCKVNQYETESIKSLFLSHGCKEVNFNDTADYYVINSCTVTNVADRKTRNIIRRAKKTNPNSKVIVTGCYVQTNLEELLKIKDIDFIISNIYKNKIIDILKENNKIAITDISNIKNYEELPFSSVRENIRAYIKIQDGCDNFCTYCKVPYARGKKRSRDINNILLEAQKLAKLNYKEIVLVGINLSSYGEDLKDITLENVIEEISKISEIERIRLSSLYPDKISDKLIYMFKTNPKLMPHLHLSLQSADDKVLKLMGRKYTQTAISIVLKKLIDNITNLSLTCDIIVGFPGETGENFKNTYNFLKEFNFYDVHIFPYSDRENTPASKYPAKVSAEIKNKRVSQLEELRKYLNKNYLEKQLGESLPVLIEEIKDNKGIGHTPNYLKVIIPNYNKPANSIETILINSIENNTLIGSF